MLALANTPKSPKEVAAVAGLERAGQPLGDAGHHLSLARQAQLTPDHRMELPPLVDGERPAPAVGAWLDAAMRHGQYGVFLCNSPEQAMTLMLLAQQGADGKALPVARGTTERPDWDRALLTLLFTDIVGSTRTAERLGDEVWRALLDEHHAIVRTQLTIFRGREINTTGDGFFASFDCPGRAVCCAQAIHVALARIDITIRAGIHTGECQTIGGHVTGVAVHVAARVAALARAGEILVSSSLRDLLAGSGFEFSDRNRHTLKGLRGTRQLFAVNRDSIALYPGMRTHR